ncbi:ADP-ribosylation family protein [Streptomyces vilmorinianum]|uniref:ADP-ribosylation family protein n=1 Tax=Streptomyces vilmorinianum TaxID=3051092 RepID=UPI0010FB6AF7|nr:ADP-ribosylation family protein [Streptomyces vilmorinianum]
MAAETERYGDPAVREAVAQRIGAEWGLELPGSFFRFLDFLAVLGPAEQRALRDLDLAPYGVMDLFADPSARPREGLDIRVHGRYYRDPPEFLTFLHGGSDGLHFGLWSDDGRTCDGVASYHSHDGGEIERRHRTPLEAVRARIEAAERDLADYAADGDAYEAERRVDLGRLRDALTRIETGERTETGLAWSQAYAYPRPAVDTDRITTLDGAGALVSGATALDRPPLGAAGAYRFATFMEELFDDAQAVRAARDEALRRAAAGDPAEALVLGRDLHRASYGRAEHEEYARELLAVAYRDLGRPALAKIAEAHHRHRALRDVDVLRPAR